MTSRTLAIAFGILMAGAATAAEVGSITGTSLSFNAATGVTQCRGDCVVTFKSTDALKIDSARMAVNQTTGTTQFLDSAHFVVGAQDFVAEKASLHHGVNGTAEFRAESIKVTKLD